jgi:putative transposase
MTTASSSPSYKGYRFPAEIISHAVWLYYRFPLSYRDVEELLAERGIVLTYETLRQWCRTFGQQYANQLRRRRACTGDKWHLDEVFLKINRKLHYLGSANKLRVKLRRGASPRAAAVALPAAIQHQGPKGR